MSADLPDDADKMQARYRELEEENRLLKLQLKKMESKVQSLLRQYFGRSSETMDPDQLQLGLDAVREDDFLAEEPSPVPVKPRSPSERRQRRIDELPILETVRLEPPLEQRTAPDGTPLVVIREEITDEVDYRPGVLFRRQIIRPVYASPSHAVRPVIAPLPARVIPGGQAGPGLIAHVVIAKYCDHVPIHRQEQILSRMGPTFSRQAMGQWVSHCTELFLPLYRGLKDEALRGRYIQMDETTIDLMDPDRSGAVREAWLWVLLAPELSIVVFDFNKSRSHAPPKAILEDFAGVLQTDGYSAYGTALAALPGHRVIRAACMAHARRDFVDALQDGDDRATPFLVLFGALYRIEADAKDMSAEQRAALRAERSVPLILQLHQRLLRASSDPQILSQSTLGQAVSYCLNRWSELTLFCEPDYGHVLIDNNPIERQIRPTKLGLKNWLFIGHPDAGQNPAVLYSIIGTCKLLKIDPWAYFNWALPRLAAATNHTAAQFTPKAFLAQRS